MGIINPKVSVIMAAYNTVKFLDKSINAVLSQTYKDFELVICDDCSTDDTYRVLQQFAQRDPRIVLLKNDVNLGPGETRNNCIKVSHGEYIAIHDSDDESVPTRLEKQIGFLDSHPEYAFVSSLVLVTEDNGFIHGKPRGGMAETKLEHFLVGSPFNHTTTVFRKEILLSIGMYPNTRATRHRSEDYEMYMKIYAKGYKGYNMQVPLAYYYEPRESYKKRKYRYRFGEVKVRYQGYRELGLMPKGLVYSIKPLISGFIPGWLMLRFRRILEK